MRLWHLPVAAVGAASTERVLLVREPKVVEEAPVLRPEPEPPSLAFPAVSIRVNATELDAVAREAAAAWTRASSGAARAWRAGAASLERMLEDRNFLVRALDASPWPLDERCAAALSAALVGAISPPYALARSVAAARRDEADRLRRAAAARLRALLAAAAGGADVDARVAAASAAAPAELRRAVAALRGLEASASPSVRAVPLAALVVAGAAACVVGLRVAGAAARAALLAAKIAGHAACLSEREKSDLFNMSVPRARVPGKASTRRERSERSSLVQQ